MNRLRESVTRVNICGISCTQISCCFAIHCRVCTSSTCSCGLVQDSYNQNELREQLVRTQAELRQRDSELACVKSVLTRRAEAVLQGDSIKKLDEITSRVESLTEERDALVHRLQQANARAQVKCCCVTLFFHNLRPGTRMQHLPCPSHPRFFECKFVCKEAQSVVFAGY